MKRILLFPTAVVFTLLCTSLQASQLHEGDSPALEMLDSNRDSKKLDGAKLKIARPFLKRTPMGAIIDEIQMLVICPLDVDGKQNDISFINKAHNVLKGYNLVSEIDDELSEMAIYIDTPRDNRFSEIILYHTRPEPSIMLFVGDFTVESLTRVGELSEQQRKNLKKNK